MPVKFPSAMAGGEKYQARQKNQQEAIDSEPTLRTLFMQRHVRRMYILKYIFTHPRISKRMIEAHSRVNEGLAGLCVLLPVANAVPRTNKRCRTTTPTI